MTVTDYIPATIARRRLLQGLFAGIWLGWLIGRIGVPSWLQ